MRLILLICCLSSWSLADELYLAPGKSVFLPAQENLTVEVEDGRVVSVKDLGDRVQLTARRIGETEVTIGPRKHRLQVVAKSIYQTFHALAEHFRPARELRVDYQEKKILLTGRIRSLAEWQRLWRLPPVPDDWILAPQVPPDLQTAVQGNFEDFLRQLRLPPAQLIFHPRIAVFIPHEFQPYKSLFDQLLGPYGISTLQHKDSLQSDELLRVQIIIAEVKKGYLRKFGLQWPSQLRAQIVPKFLWEEGNEASLLAADMLESQGWGKVLASPNLLCQNGHEAEFMAGGEIPIPTSFGHEIAWKKHGILLKIKPHISPAGPMQIQLVTEISSLDFSSAINGIPGLASNRLSTVFSLQDSQPIVLSGLVKKDMGRQTDGLPWLSRLPIIGPLFSSTTFQNNQSELVIVVFPQKVRPENAQVNNEAG